MKRTIALALSMCFYSRDEESTVALNEQWQRILEGDDEDDHEECNHEDETLLVALIAHAQMSMWQCSLGREREREREIGEKGNQNIRERVWQEGRDISHFCLCHLVSMCESGYYLIDRVGVRRYMKEGKRDAERSNVSAQWRTLTM